MNNFPLNENLKMSTNKNMKQIVLEDGDYMVMPHWLCMLEFDEAYIMGYLIDAENISHLTYQYEGEEYFMCDIEGFMLKMFVNSNAKKMRRVMDKLIDYGLIKKLIIRDGFATHTYLNIDYNKCKQYAIAFKERKVPDKTKVIKVVSAGC